MSRICYVLYPEIDRRLCDYEDRVQGERTPLFVFEVRFRASGVHWLLNTVTTFLTFSAREVHVRLTQEDVIAFQDSRRMQHRRKLRPRRRLASEVWKKVKIPSHAGCATGVELSWKQRIRSGDASRVASPGRFDSHYSDGSPTLTSSPLKRATPRGDTFPLSPLPTTNAKPASTMPGR